MTRLQENNRKEDAFIASIIAEEVNTVQGTAGYGLTRQQYIDLFRGGKEIRAITYGKPIIHGKVS